MHVHVGGLYFHSKLVFIYQPIFIPYSLTDLKYTTIY
jgi:hypothetical protein